jgi:hypothetical protein
MICALMPKISEDISADQWPDHIRRLMSARATIFGYSTVAGRL